MLSRTAASLYWLGRYTERSENLARILGVGCRMGQVPAWSVGSGDETWKSFALAAGCEAGLLEKHGRATLQSVIAYMVLDETNASSIHACLKQARANARAVRTALTSEMWECLNDTWLHFDGHWRPTLSQDTFLSFLEWVRDRSTLFRGAMRGTMLRDDTFHFLNVGTYIERADNTARILDMKYHILLPPGESLGGAIDYYQWSTVLRAVSALGSYHWVYREPIRPWLVAELLILREEMPRSLRYSIRQVSRYLDAIATGHGQRHECHRLGGQLHARLTFAKIEDVFQGGLHEYLSDFLARNAALGSEIERSFHF
jgi:uncharacterized alpha-E superfamily protein